MYALLLFQLTCLPCRVVIDVATRHLHRDISLRNVLMGDEPAKRKTFEIPKEF